MSLPNIPDISPSIGIDINDVANLLLASIAFEELGLAHIINAEAEKIQFVLGTLNEKNNDLNCHNNTVIPTIDDLIAIDKTVDRVLRDVIKKEMLLEFKLDDVLQISTSSTTTTTTTTTTTSTTSTTTTTTCRPCLTGSGTGDLSTECDPRFSQFNILDPRINASSCDPAVTDPDYLAFRAQLIPSPGGAQSLLMIADINTLMFDCTGNTLTLKGSGSATLNLSGGTEESGPVTFTYTFVDNSTQGNQDDIGIVITGVNDADLSFTTCGLRDLTGNITVGCCPTG